MNQGTFPACEHSITRRLDSVLLELDDAFRSLYTNTDLQRKLQALRDCTPDVRPGLIEDLREMFDACGIPCQVDRENGYYEALAAASDFPTYDELEHRLLRMLYEKYPDFPTPESYMRRIVDRMEGRTSQEPLRLRILKRFLSHGEGLQAAGYKGVAHIRKYISARTGKTGKAITTELILEHLEDDVFDCLPGSKPVQRQADGTYGLLSLSEDLATGRFRSGGSTKRALYLFAMVYEMTFQLDDRREVADTDIERNLFTDYYANNLLRFITESYRANRAAYERDPSGQGINYKNFAEMVYLYYLTRPGMTPAARIAGAETMIRTLTVEARGGGPAPEAPASGETRLYRSMFTEDILRLPEDEFKTFLRDHYNCNTDLGDHIGGPFGLEEDQNSAFQVYRRLVTAIDTQEPALRDYDYGLSLSSMDFKVLRRLLREQPEPGDRATAAARDLQATQAQLERIFGPDAGDEDHRRFLELLLCVHGFLSSERQDGGRPDALTVSEPRRMTRTTLLVAFYYRFIQSHFDENGAWMSFVELYDSFRAGADPLLDAAGYQRVNGKNIFDILLAFSAYHYLNF